MPGSSGVSVLLLNCLQCPVWMGELGRGCGVIGHCLQRHRWVRGVRECGARDAGEGKLEESWEWSWASAPSAAPALVPGWCCHPAQ